MPLLCSVWNGVYDYDYNPNRQEILIPDFVESVKNGTWKESVGKVRAEPDKKERSKLKEKITAVTLSGVFKERRASGLVDHSGFICVDFDDVENIQEIKKSFPADKYISGWFTSVSGKGLAVLVRIEPLRHKEAYIALEKYFYDKYNLDADVACKDVCRMRCVSYDPEASFCSSKEIFREYLKPEKQKKAYTTIPCTNSDVGKIVAQAVASGISMGGTYGERQRLAASLATLGEAGRQYFHTLLQASPKYVASGADKKFSNLLNSADGSITIGTFYHYAKLAGLQTNREKSVSIVKVCKEIKRINGKSVDNAIDRLKKKRIICTGPDNENAEDVELVKKVYEEAEVGDVEGIQELQDFVLEHFPVRKNVITQCHEIDGGIELTDRQYSEIYIEAKKQFPATRKADVMDILESKSPEFNPLLDYIESHRCLITEGRTIGSIERLAQTLTSDSGISGEAFDTEYEHHFIAKWFVGIISSIHGKHSPLLLALTGKINTGKTEWLRRLWPKELIKYYGEPDLDNDKDTDICMAKYLIIMDDELSGKSRMEEKHLKKLTSRDKISVRIPYGRTTVNLKRLAVLCGSTNDTMILSDPTGNRRIIPINVLKINYDDYNKIDKDCLFMEAVRLYEEGYAWELSNLDIERLRKNTVHNQIDSHERELLQNLIRQPKIEGEISVKFLNATMIGDHLMANSQYKKVSPRVIGVEMQRMGFERKQKYVNGVPMHGYEVVLLSRNEVSLGWQR